MRIKRSLFRSSHPEVLCKKGALKNVRNIQKKTPVLELENTRNFIKEKTCFPVNITKFLRIPILKNVCEQLVLFIILTTVLFLPVKVWKKFFFQKLITESAGALQRSSS